MNELQAKLDLVKRHSEQYVPKEEHEDFRDKTSPGGKLQNNRYRVVVGQ